MNPLAEIFRYNRWATARVVEACHALTDEQLDAPMRGADTRSIRIQLLHLVGGQQTFALRTQGRQHEGELSAASPWPGFDRLADLAAASSDDLVRIAEGLERDAEIVLPWQAARPRFPRSFFLAHAAEHGTEHRTNIAAALAGMGLQPPNLDGWAFAEAMGYGQE